MRTFLALLIISQVALAQNAEVSKKEQEKPKCKDQISCATSCYEQLHVGLGEQFEMPGRITGNTFKSDKSPYIVYPDSRSGTEGFYIFEYGKSEGTFVKYGKELKGKGPTQLVIQKNAKETAKISLIPNKDQFQYYTFEDIQPGEKGFKVNTAKEKLVAGIDTRSEFPILDDEAARSLIGLLIGTAETLLPNKSSYSARMGNPWYKRDREAILAGIKHCKEVIKAEVPLEIALTVLQQEVCAPPGAPEDCPKKSVSPNQNQNTRDY